jgi:hypothetical protein
MSEVGLMKKTEGKSPEDLAQTLRAALANVPYSSFIMESTAKGVGNFFHREWQNACKTDTSYRAIFVAWFEIDLYQKPLEELSEPIDQWFSKWTDYHWYLWNMGATLEGIHWYFSFKADENYDDWRMQSEYPSDPNEAFQSTGQRVFAPKYVKQMRTLCTDPILVGDIFGDEKKFTNLEIKESPHGPLWVWKMPEKSDYKNRYCAYLDIGGTTDQADWSVLTVMDRYWMKDGGVPEVVCTYRIHLDQDLVVWKAAQICWLYDTALLAVETNSLNTREEVTEGHHFYTVLDEIGDYYPNLFSRLPPEQILGRPPRIYGFHMNVKSKGNLVDNYRSLLRNIGYVEYDERALDEADVYEVKQNGSMGAVEGNHDDILITRMGAGWLATSYMDPIVEIKREAGLRKVKKASYADL